MSEIPQSLLDKYGAELLKGMRALEYRRDELERQKQLEQRQTFDISRSCILPVQPQPQTQPLSEPEPLQQLSPVKAQAVYPAELKVWALVGLAAVRSAHGGGWRLWALAKALDVAGSGYVSKDELSGYAKSLAVSSRNFRRWLSDAQSSKLITLSRDGKRCSLVSLWRAAEYLGAHKIGRAAIVSAAQLVGSGWRAVVWSAYLTTTKAQPISQACKAEITGIDERTQRNYQAALPGEAIHNIARTGISSDALTGMREFVPGVFYIGRDGKVYQKLPDARIVPLFVSRLAAHTGRSKKAQRILNTRDIGAGKGDVPVKLFHSKLEQTKSTQRKIRKSSDIQADKLFVYRGAQKSTAYWDTLALETSPF